MFTVGCFKEGLGVDEGCKVVVLCAYAMMLMHTAFFINVPLLACSSTWTAATC